MTPWYEAAVQFVGALRALILSVRRRVDVALFGRAPGASVHVRVVAIHVRELPVRAVAVHVRELPARFVAVRVHGRPVRDVQGPVVCYPEAVKPVVCCPEALRPVDRDVRET